jgi:hypothetical protein
MHGGRVELNVAAEAKAQPWKARPRLRQHLYRANRVAMQGGVKVDLLIFLFLFRQGFGAEEKDYEERERL